MRGARPGRVRLALSALPCPIRAQGPPGVTVSVGIAVTACPDRGLASYYGLADTALYAAKQHGRDAVWIVEAGPEADDQPRPSGSVWGSNTRMWL